MGRSSCAGTLTKARMLRRLQGDAEGSSKGFLLPGRKTIANSTWRTPTNSYRVQGQRAFSSRTARLLVGLVGACPAKFPKLSKHFIVIQTNWRTNLATTCITNNILGWLRGTSKPRGAQLVRDMQLLTLPACPVRSPCSSLDPSAASNAALTHPCLR